MSLIADTGATDSMSRHGPKMHNYFPAQKNSHTVEGADGTSWEVLGYGDLKGTVKARDGTQFMNSSTNGCYMLQNLYCLSQK